MPLSPHQAHLILNGDDLSVLESQGHAQRLNGTLRIKKRLTYSPEILKDDGTILLPPNFAANIPTTTALSPQADDSWITLPLMFHSQETYEHIGFNATQSARFWDFWHSLDPEYRAHDGEEYCFLWHTEEYVRRQVDDPATRLDDWYGTLQKWGIREDLINSILDPAFTQVRLTQSAKDILFAVIHDVYTFLLSVRSVSDQRDARRKSMAVSEVSVPPTIEALEGTWASIADGICDESVLNHSAAPDNIVLYRGDILSNLLTSYMHNKPSFLPVCALGTHHGSNGSGDGDSTPRLPDKQLVETNLILNTNNQSALYNNNICAPADFTSMVPAWHFTPQLSIAKQFAEYTAKKVPASVPVIVRFELPRALFEGKQPAIHHTFSSWQSDTWKRFVWHKRNQDFVPKDLKAEISYSTQLLIGPITRAHDEDVRGMKGWEDIDQRHVYKVGEKYERGEGGEDSDGFEVGVQYVFPMSFAGDRTDLMEEIYARCRNNFRVCRLRDADTGLIK